LASVQRLSYAHGRLGAENATGCGHGRSEHQVIGDDPMRARALLTGAGRPMQPTLGRQARLGTTWISLPTPIGKPKLVVAQERRHNDPPSARISQPSSPANPSYSSRPAFWTSLRLADTGRARRHPGPMPCCRLEMGCGACGTERVNEVRDSTPSFRCVAEGEQQACWRRGRPRGRPRQRRCARDSWFRSPWRRS